MNNFKNCLVTGGAGFIGSHLVERLLAEGCRVTCLDDLSEGKWENLPKHPKLIKVRASILGNISKYVSQNEVIFHLAAIPRLQKSLAFPWRSHRANIDGTLKLLLLAKKHKIKKFIFASSSSVYGNQNRLPFKETMVPNPLVPYSLQKLTGEKYCQMFSDLWGLETVSLRYFSVYGPRMNPDGAYALLIPKFIKLISQEIRPTINGDGKQIRDFTYVSDVVDATLLAAESDLSGEVFNIGAGKAVSVNDVAQIINRIMGKNIKPVHGPPVIEPKATLSSSEKARKFLGWKPKVDLEKGLKMMLKMTG
ncbi:MAG: NAD-dependent epimerase/dehydratase family protein [Candidatus Levybacteria bacterium]|nr:NAD-dependent epimerase/dehydratase family protein [Candidatus Levybacteria bacterium]